MVVLEIKFLTGADIEGACGEARRLAGILSVSISFDFNGIRVFIRPSSLPEAGVVAYHTALKNKQYFAIA